MLLDFQKTSQLLQKYQLPLVGSLLIENVEQGLEFCSQNGYPVVLKLLSQQDLHKVDRGLVKLNIQNEQELEKAFQDLTQLNLPEASLIIQKQAKGQEIFVGMKRDKSFGPVVSFGLGGIFVEALDDVAFAICPVNKEQALDLIRSIKGYKILQGYRGQEKVNENRLVELLVNVCKMGQENEQIKEIDFNPIIAKGSDIFVVDPKLIL